MRYPTPLLHGALIRRYKRFLADVLLDDGHEITVHCPNSGSMAGLTRPGNPVRISGPYAPTRKYLYTLEQVRIRRPDGRRIWVGVNTSVPNKIVREAAERGRLPGLEAYTKVSSEVKLGERSRIDLLLQGEGLPDCWVEVKNVTLVLPDPSHKAPLNVGDIACFPDAVTTRGAKHLEELVARVQVGDRAAMVYTVQRSDGRRFAPAAGFDPVYAGLWQAARGAGVQMLPMATRMNTKSVTLTGPLALV